MISKLMIPEELIDAITHGIDETVVFVDDEINDSWQNQLAEFDAESTNRQEVLQIGVCEALGDTTGNLDDPLGVIPVVLYRPQRIFWIHDFAKSRSVHTKRCLLDVTAMRKWSDVVDLQRCALKDDRQVF